MSARTRFSSRACCTRILQSGRGQAWAVTFLQPSENKNGCHKVHLIHRTAPPQSSAKLPRSGRNQERAMVGYAERRTLDPPTEVQRKFLETLREVGPRDNAQTPAIRKITKRACQVRGWVEWRRIDGVLDRKAWHLTIAGQKALNSLNSKAIPRPGSTPADVARYI